MTLSKRSSSAKSSFSLPSFINSIFLARKLNSFSHQLLSVSTCTLASFVSFALASLALLKLWVKSPSPKSKEAVLPFSSPSPFQVCFKFSQEFFVSATCLSPIAFKSAASFALLSTRLFILAASSLSAKPKKSFVV